MPTTSKPKRDELLISSIAAPRCEELFTPTVTAEDDAVGFDYPWNPYSIVFATFFAGVFAGGLLFALNYRRLGQPRRCLPVAVGASAIAIVVYLMANLLIGKGIVQIDGIQPHRIVKFITQMLAVILALAMAATQHKRFRLAQYSDQPLGRLLLPGLAAVALGVIVERWGTPLMDRLTDLEFTA